MFQSGRLLNKLSIFTIKSKKKSIEDQFFGLKKLCLLTFTQESMKMFQRVLITC